MKFEIRYKFHWCWPCEQYGDTKEETIIRSDGTITIRQYDHHGPNGHYRIVKRGLASADSASVKKLYKELLDLIHYHEEYSPMLMDADAEIVLEEPGLKISADASISNGKKFGGNMIDEFIERHELHWESKI